MDAQTTISVLLEQLVETHLERNLARAQHAELAKEVGEIRADLAELKKPPTPPKRRRAL